MLELHHDTVFITVCSFVVVSEEANNIRHTEVIVEEASKEGIGPCVAELGLRGPVRVVL